MKIFFDDLGFPLSVPAHEQHKKPDYSSLFRLQNLLKTSLGPFGRDKILQTADDEIIFTNDGATILKNIDLRSLRVENEKLKDMFDFCGSICLSLAEAQDSEIGDGTTSVILIAAQLMKEVQDLLHKNYASIKVIKILHEILKFVHKIFEKIGEPVNFNNMAIYAAQTALNSKIVGLKKKITGKNYGFFSGANSVKSLANLCVDSIALIKTDCINLDRIKIIKREGASISESAFFPGLIIEKSLAHFQMKKITEGKIGLLASPLELPKIKTKFELQLRSGSEFEKLVNFEKNYFSTQIKILKEKKISILFCQWGFEDEMTSLLLENEITAVRWTGGSDMEKLALLFEIPIASSVEKLEGANGRLEEVSETDGKKHLCITGPGKMATVIMRANSQIGLDEVERAFFDAQCAVKNLFENPCIVYGGGNCESIVASLLCEEGKNKDSAVYDAFARSLLFIPQMLIKNGDFPFSVIDDLPTFSLEELHNGGNIMHEGVGGNMKEQSVFCTVREKYVQYKMAVEVVVRLLKCDRVFFYD